MTTKATLCFIVRDGRILLIKKKRGFGAGKWNAPGGKLEDGETLESAVCRELKEEIGIVPKEPQLLAEIEFFNDDSFEWHVYAFRSADFSGTLKETAEAKPQWFSVDEIPYDGMWIDDRHWLPLFLEGKRLRARFYFKNEWKDIEHYNIEEL